MLPLGHTHRSGTRSRQVGTYPCTELQYIFVLFSSIADQVSLHHHGPSGTNYESLFINHGQLAPPTLFIDLQSFCDQNTKISNSFLLYLCRKLQLKRQCLLSQGSEGKQGSAWRKEQDHYDPTTLPPDDRKINITANQCLETWILESGRLELKTCLVTF